MIEKLIIIFCFLNPDFPQLISAVVGIRWLVSHSRGLLKGFELQDYSQNVRLELELLEERRFRSGVVFLRYQVTLKAMPT